MVKEAYWGYFWASFEEPIAWSLRCFGLLGPQTRAKMMPKIAHVWVQCCLLRFGAGAASKPPTVGEVCRLANINSISLPSPSTPCHLQVKRVASAPPRIKASLPNPTVASWSPHPSPPNLPKSTNPWCTCHTHSLPSLPTPSRRPLIWCVNRTRVSKVGRQDQGPPNSLPARAK